MKMQVMKPTMGLIFNNFLLLVLWTFNSICEYALPMVRWLLGSQMNIEEKSNEGHLHNEEKIEYKDAS